MMQVYIATDHAGFDLKNELVTHLTNLGHTVSDLGAHTLDAEDDYPDFIQPLAEKIAAGKGVGIVLGGSGQGEAMVANRISGVRAALYYGGDLSIIKLAREHNDANVLSLGARFVSVDEAKKAIELFLSTPFQGEERHVRRIAKLN